MQLYILVYMSIHNDKTILNYWESTCMFDILFSRINYKYHWNCWFSNYFVALSHLCQFKPVHSTAYDDGTISSSISVLPLSKSALQRVFLSVLTKSKHFVYEEWDTSKLVRVEAAQKTRRRNGSLYVQSIQYLYFNYKAILMLKSFTSAFMVPVRDNEQKQTESK